MLPITATQFGMNRFLEQVYKNALGSEPKDYGKIGVAMAAGSASAIFGCPAEFLMIQQQRTGKSLSMVSREIISTYGPLAIYKGLVRLNRSLWM